MMSQTYILENDLDHTKLYDILEERSILDEEVKEVRNYGLYKLFNIEGVPISIVNPHNNSIKSIRGRLTLTIWKKIEEVGPTKERLGKMVGASLKDWPKQPSSPQ